MIVFWLVCILFIVLALALVLPPLLNTATPIDARRAALDQAHKAGALDATEYAVKLNALDQSVVGPLPDKTGARLAALLIVIGLPLISIGLYAKLGDSRVFDPAVQQVAAAMQQAQQDGMPPMEQAIAGLVERLARQPDDLEGWVLLGRAYKATEHFEQARDALARALMLAPEDPGLMVEYAEAKTLAAPDKRFAAEALQMLDQALATDPNHQRALWLRGIAYYQAGDIEAASRTWEHLLTVLPQDSTVRDSVMQQLEQLRAGTTDSSNSAPATGASTSSIGTPRLRVKVSLAPEFVSKVQSDDVLFVFARAAEGSRAPLAIQRLRASDLPLEIELSDADAMVPQMNLSSTAELVVGARISRSGNAQAQSGDLETLSAVMPNSHSETIELVIDHLVP